MLRFQSYLRSMWKHSVAFLLILAKFRVISQRSSYVFFHFFTPFTKVSEISEGWLRNKFKIHTHIQGSLLSALIRTYQVWLYVYPTTFPQRCIPNEAYIWSCDEPFYPLLKTVSLMFLRPPCHSSPQFAKLILKFTVAKILLQHQKRGDKLQRHIALIQLESVSSVVTKIHATKLGFWPTTTTNQNQ
jgi:hypothetical protein